MRMAGSARWWLVLSVLLTVCGVALSVQVGLRVTRDSDASANAAMDGRAQLVADAVAAETSRYTGVLQLVTDDVGSYQWFTQGKFLKATASLDRANLAGVTSISFVAPPVESGGVPQLQAYWRSRGSTGLVLAPKGTGEHLFAVMSRSLSARSRTGPRVDITQAKAAYWALIESRILNRVTVSDTYTLLIDRQLPAAQRQLSFLLTAPVWVSEPAGGKTFRGWVALGIRGQDFAQATLSRASQRLSDVSLSAQDSEHHLVRVAAVRAPGHARRDLHRTRTVQVGQQKWTLNIDADSSHLTGANGDPGRLIGWGGSILSVLLGALVLALATGRSRARAAAARATIRSRAAEDTARRQAGFLTNVLESISEAVAVVDSDGEFLVQNRAARQLLGVEKMGKQPVNSLYDPKKAAIENWQSQYGLFTPDGDRPFPPEDLPLTRALSGECTNDVVMMICNPSHPEGVLISANARPLDSSVTPDAKAAAVAVFRDITAERAQKTELEAFAGVVAHDLRGPLTVAAGYAELVSGLAIPALHRAGENDAARTAEQHLNTIRTSAFDGSALINDLLDYASAGDAALDIATVDLEELVRTVVSAHQARMTAQQASHGASPSTSMRGLTSPGTAEIFIGALPPVQADRARLRQVLDNVIGNAFKYARPQEPIRIDVTAAPPGAVMENGIQPVTIEIADRGIGIPYGEHATIFQAFHRAPGAESSASGHGLGLAICRRIVERQHGRITAADNPGGGTRILLTLPAGETAASVSGLAQRPHPDPSRELPDLAWASH